MLGPFERLERDYSGFIETKPYNIYINVCIYKCISNKLQIMSDIKLPCFDFLYMLVALLGFLEIAVVSEYLHCVGVAIVVANPLKFDLQLHQELLK